MRYNGCSGLLSAAGVPLYAREQGPYSVQADDGITYRSDGNLWQRDPTVSPVTPAGYDVTSSPAMPPPIPPTGPDTSILAAGYGSECPQVMPESDRSDGDRVAAAGSEPSRNWRTVMTKRKYHGCTSLTVPGGEALWAGAILWAGTVSRGDDGALYKSNGKCWRQMVEVPLVPDPYASFILPTNSAERKRVPLWSGLFRYFPDALVAVARLSWAGNEKHNKGQPLHWSRDKSNDHADCLLRHQMDTGTGEVDPDSKELHEVEVAWRALAQAQLALERQRQGGKR